MIYQRHLLWSLTTATLLTACAVGPDYERPDVNVPNQFRSAQTTSTDGAALGTVTSTDAWWEAFDDPELNTLVEEGLRNNRDLQSAIARVRQARGQLITTRSHPARHGAVAALARRERRWSRARRRPAASFPGPRSSRSAGGLAGRHRSALLTVCRRAARSSSVSRWHG